MEIPRLHFILNTAFAVTSVTLILWVPAPECLSLHCCFRGIFSSLYTLIFFIDVLEQRPLPVIRLVSKKRSERIPKLKALLDQAK
jgi:hypothetical protein